MELNLDHSDISLPASPSRTNLKVHNILVTPKLVKVITNPDLSKTPGPDCISMVVLKTGKSDLSHILADLFDMFLKESCFSEC